MGETMLGSLSIRSCINLYYKTLSHQRELFMRFRLQPVCVLH